MSKNAVYRRRGIAIIAILVALLMITSMACNLLNILKDDKEPEVQQEEPVVVEEVEEPAEEEPVVNEEIEEPVQEEVQEEVQQPAQLQSSSELIGDTLYVLDKQGVIKDEYYTYGAFVAGNPRTDCMYNYGKYDYVAYDADNNELYTDSGYLEVALPGGQVLEVIYFPEEAENADHFDVMLDAGDCIPAPATVDSLTISNPNIYDDDFYPTVTAIVNNTMDDFQTDVFVGALAYDSAGQIIGVGSSYIDHIYPNDYTGVEVYLNTTEGSEIASVEFIPTHSYFSKIGLDQSFFNTAYIADELPWIQIEDKYETVFYIINDDPTNAALDIEYRMTIVDESNNVLSVETGWIDYVLPGDVSPVYVSAQLPEGTMAYTHFVELSPGEFGASPFASNPFTTANYSIDETGWTPAVTFDLTNGSDKAVSGLDMVVILYDADENFIGGGYTSSDIISGNSTVGQEVNVNVLGVADSVDVYLVIDYWTEIEGWEN